MCRVLITEYYVPCPMYHALCPKPSGLNTMYYSLRTEHHAPGTMGWTLWTMSQGLCPKDWTPCAMRHVLCTRVKAPSFWKFPRNWPLAMCLVMGPFIISCLVKGLQFDFRIIKRFIINKTNNELMIMIIIIVCVIFKSRIKNMIFSIFCYFTKLINMILWFYQLNMKGF